LLLFPRAGMMLGRVQEGLQRREQGPKADLS